MYRLMANFDKEQYVTQQVFTGAHSVLGCPEDVRCRGWFYGLALLLDSAPHRCRRNDEGVRPGQWAGDRVTLITGGDRAADRFRPEDMQALEALGSPRLDTAYAYVRANFQDISAGLFQLVQDRTEAAAEPAACQHDWHIRRRDLAGLTIQELEPALDEAAFSGVAYFRQFLNWLAGQPGVSSQVQSYLKRCVHDYGAWTRKHPHWWRLLP